MNEAIEAAARAGDREDSAQRGEPCPWTHPDLKGEDDPVFVADRCAVYRAAVLAFLESDGAIEIGARALYQASSFPMPGVPPRSWETWAEQLPADAAIYRTQASAMLAALRSLASPQAGGRE